MKLFVLLATAALSLLLIAGGTVGFMRFLLIAVPSIMGLMALLHLAQAIRKAFSRREAPMMVAARSLRLKKTFSPTSQSQGHWTVIQDPPEREEPSY